MTFPVAFNADEESKKQKGKAATALVTSSFQHIRQLTGSVQNSLTERHRKPDSTCLRQRKINSVLLWKRTVYGTQDVFIS